MRGNRPRTAQDGPGRPRMAHFGPQAPLGPFLAKFGLIWFIWPPCSPCIFSYQTWFSLAHFGPQAPLGSFLVKFGSFWPILAPRFPLALFASNSAEFASFWPPGSPSAFPHQICLNLANFRSQVHLGSFVFILAHLGLPPAARGHL